jgi:beta-glucanase (GH16 family)
MAKLLWSDDFKKPGLPDPAKWEYEVGGDGWGNNELQFYTKARRENARIENGMLVIEARKEIWEGKGFTSSRLKSRAAWKYGRFEVRAKLPLGRGTWPAIWMLPEPMGSWPRGGEIDIMEHVGFDPNRVHQTIHTEAFNHMKGTQKAFDRIVPDAGAAFHTYAIDWRAERIVFLIDGKERFVYAQPVGATEAEWPFDKPFAFRLNLAVGGNWGGQKGVDESVFPQRFEIDFVRVVA